MGSFRWVLICSVILGFCATALAAAPAGHPTVKEAGQALKLPPTEAELSHSGTVLQAIPSNEYIYIEVKSKERNLWLAAPATELKAGDTIHFPEGTMMRNFYSKRLKRTFDEVLFVGRIKVQGK